MSVFDNLQKTAEEGAERWEKIEELAKKMKLPNDVAGKAKDNQKLLLALVEYMRPMAPSKNQLKDATGELENMLAELAGKMNV